MVVDDNLDDRNVVPGSGGDLVHIHTEAAVSGDVDDGLLRAAHFGSDGCAQAVTHGAQAPGSQKLMGLFVFIILSRPHLMLTNLGDDQSISLGDPVELFHHIGAGETCRILTVIIMVAAAAGIYFYTPRYVLPSLRERSHPASEAGV